MAISILIKRYSFKCLSFVFFCVRPLISNDISKNILDAFVALKDDKEYGQRIREMHLAELELKKEEIDFKIIGF